SKSRWINSCGIYSCEHCKASCKHRQSTLGTGKRKTGELHRSPRTLTFQSFVHCDGF
ncbi:mCG146006, partial [Mus musculus]